MSSKHTNEWKLGLFVVSAAAVGVLALLWLGASRLSRDSFETVQFFDEAVDGLEVGSPVKFRGVTIGQVQGITTAGDRRHVRVDTKIYKDEMRRMGLPTRFEEETQDSGLRVQLVTSALTGVSFLQGDFFDPEKHPAPSYPFPTPPNVVHTVPSTMKSLETSLVDSMSSIPDLVDQVGHILTRFETAIDDVQFKEISSKLVQLMSSVQYRLDSLDQMPILVEGEAAMVEAHGAMGELRAVLRELSGEEGAIEKLTARYETLGRELEVAVVEADLPGTTATLRHVGESVGGVTGEFEALAVELRETLISLRQLTDMLQRDPGALLHGKTPTTLPD